jgi:non-ribosomal peptide synthase protein (TIGR01720 family)
VNAHAVLLLPPGTLPKTSSGKIRRKACRDAYLAGTVETRYQSLRDEVGGLAGRVGALPRTPVEEALAGVWHKVLGVETIGIHDDFFALGGDSLLVMQIVAGCRAAGLGVTPEQIFQHPTIARLAAIAATEPVGRVTGTERVVGPVPLLPRQRQLFAQHENRVPDRDVLPITLGADAHIDSTLLEEAVRLVMDHHDSLRMRFQLDSDSWTQECLDRVEYDVVKTVDISNLTSGERKAAIKSETARLRESIDIEKGRLVRIAHFDSGTDRATRLVLIVHHLAVDSYCLPTVVEDLETAYRALATKQPVRLPPGTTSVRAWVERLVEIAESEEMRDEAAYWAEMVTRQRGDITPDYPDWAGTRGARERVTISLSQPETDALLRTLPRETGIQLTDALCAAVATSYASLTGFETVAVGLANHGRERVYDDIDLSRTVGFFTSSFPAILDVPGMDTPRLEVARRLREQIDRIPRHGLGLGVVRYLYRGPEREIVRAAPHPVLGLNYQGRFDRLYSGLSLLRPEGESSSEPTSGRPVRATPRIQVAARIQGDSLHVVCNYHERVYAEETIRRFAERVGAVLTAFAGEVTGAVVAGEPVSP